MDTVILELEEFAPCEQFNACTGFLCLPALQGRRLNLHRRLHAQQCRPCFNIHLSNRACSVLQTRAYYPLNQFSPIITVSTAPSPGFTTPWISSVPSYTRVDPFLAIITVSTTPGARLYYPLDLLCTIIHPRGQVFGDLTHPRTSSRRSSLCPPPLPIGLTPLWSHFRRSSL